MRKSKIILLECETIKIKNEKMTKIQSYEAIATDLRSEYPDLTQFETLTLAIQIQKNEILENAFNVSRNDNYPSSLEAIAISLGYTSDQFKQTITEVLKRNEK